MIVEILSIGTELLMGQITNTDAAFLARRLRDLGLTHYHQSVIGDNAGRVREALRIAFSRSDVVITSGGLGPTQDDMTKQAVSDVVGAPLVLDEASAETLRGFFARRGQEMTPNNLRQAMFPRGCEILPNDCGTAPGCIVAKGDKHLVMLPGPPHELQDMFDKRVAPWLEARSDARLESVVLRIYGMGESAVEHALRDLIDAQTNPTIALYCGIGEVTVRVTVRLPKNGGDPALSAARDAVVAEIRARMGDFVYGEGESSLAEVVARGCIAQRRTLAVAESCTGGMVCEQLVAVPGVSAVLLEGCVAYANEAKVRTLGVREETLAAHGAVSARTAREMAEGIRARAGAWAGIATTGVAGPDGGTPEKPVGLVYVALATPEGTHVRELRNAGTRERIRLMSTYAALDLARRALAGLPMA